MEGWTLKQETGAFLPRRPYMWLYMYRMVGETDAQKTKKRENYMHRTLIKNNNLKN